MSTVCSETVGSWTPIGATGTYFAGTYNGNYNIIKNLYANSNQYNFLGFFFRIAGNATIQNIVMQNAYVYSNCSNTTSTAAIICGYMDHNATIKNCGIDSGSLTLNSSGSDKYIGGIASLSNGFILNCYNKAKVTSIGNMSENDSICGAGIVGHNANEIINCYNRGDIVIKNYNAYIGGIAGLTVNNKYYMGVDKIPELKNCYNVGDFDITSNFSLAGGIAGSNGYYTQQPAGLITKSYCIDNTTYSYYYYSSEFKTSTAERRSAEELKTYASTLGSAFAEDTNNINNGYPILKWQVQTNE